MSRKLLKRLKTSLENSSTLGRAPKTKAYHVSEIASFTFVVINRNKRLISFVN